MTVSWESPADPVTGYVIYYQTKGGPVISDMVSGGETETHSLDGLQRGITYYISILALSQHLPSPLVGNVTVVVPHIITPTSISSTSLKSTNGPDDILSSTEPTHESIFSSTSITSFTSSSDNREESDKTDQTAPQPTTISLQAYATNTNILTTDIARTPISTSQLSIMGINATLVQHTDIGIRSFPPNSKLQLNISPFSPTGDLKITILGWFGWFVEIIGQEIDDDDGEGSDSVITEGLTAAVAIVVGLLLIPFIFAAIVLWWKLVNSL